MVLLYGPRGWHFLVREVTLYTRILDEDLTTSAGFACQRSTTRKLIYLTLSNVAHPVWAQRSQILKTAIPQQGANTENCTTSTGFAFQRSTANTLMAVSTIPYQMPAFGVPAYVPTRYSKG